VAERARNESESPEARQKREASQEKKKPAFGGKKSVINPFAGKGKKDTKPSLSKQSSGPN
jgi:hypothetical protein